MNKVYEQTARAINEELGRKAVTPELLESLVAEAKQVRQRRGTKGLIEYASGIPALLFTEDEIERLQGSPKYHSMMVKMVDLLVYEKVISPFEAMLLKRYI